MDHTEQAYLAPAQCNQLQFDDKNDGAMFASAAVSCNSSTATNTDKRWGKLRPTPGLVKSTIRKFDIDDVQACGENMLAVAMVGDIRFWLEPSKETGKPRSKIEHDGHIWVARSIANWGLHFNIKSVQKVKTAIKALVASKKVVSEEFWFNGNRTPHYRLAELEGEGVKNNTPHVEINTPHVEINTPITEKYQSGIKEVEKSLGAASPTPETGTASLGQGEATSTPTPTSKPTPDPTAKTAEIGKPPKLKTGFEKGSANITNGKEETPVPALMKILKDGLLSEFGQYTGTPTDEELGQLRNFRNRIREGGFDPVKVLLGLMQGATWKPIASHLYYVEKIAAPFPTPKTLGMKSATDKIINMWIKAREQAAQKAAQQAVKANVIPVQQPAPPAAPSASNDKPSLDYCNATMAELDAILKSKA